MTGLTYKAFPLKHSHGTSVVFEADPNGMWVNRSEFEEVLSTLISARDALASLPKSLAYDLTELPKINETLRKYLP